MSRKIKVEEKVTSVMKSEILQVADIVAKEKGIDKEDILAAMEQAILRTAQMKYGDEKNVLASIDRRTGEIDIFMERNVVSDVSDRSREVSLMEALQSDPDAEIGTKIREKLPALDFGRVAAQSARQIIVQKVKIAERNKQYDEFFGRIGEIITGVVKRVDFSEVVLDVGRTEGVLRKNDVIPNETFKLGDRIKVLLVDINKDSAAPLLQLSRTHPSFLKKLFEQEVPEIYDGVIKIIAVARDPGSKAKMAVTTSDSNVDPIGACVGVRGSRVQSVVDELKGEKIDIILWSDNPATFVINSLSPATISRIILDEESNCVDAVVPSESLSAAIGRRGQNVRLASKLTGWNISVISEEEDAKNRAAESARILGVFMNDLDVDEMVAHLLMGEGYEGIDDIVSSSIEDLASIDGFDEDIASQIHQRAVFWMEKKKKELEELCAEKNVSADLIEYRMIRSDLLETLVRADIKSLEDLGALSTDELLEIVGTLLSKSEAETLIMSIRKKWFNEE